MLLVRRVRRLLRYARVTASPLRFVAVRLRAWREWGADKTPVDVKVGNLVVAVRGKDWVALDEILMEHEYAAALDVIANAESPVVVIDGGANVGLFSASVLACRPESRVVAFEASAETYAVLAANAAKNPHVRWECHQAAILDRVTTVRFGSPYDASTGARISDSGGEEVTTTPLRDVIVDIGGRITLLKLDVEGAEEAALTNAADVLDRVDHIVVEIHPDRVDEANVMRILKGAFPYIAPIPGRQSSKPLVLASRSEVRFGDVGV